MGKINVRVTFLDEVLGTASSDPNIHEEFIASKAPDAPSREEEVAALGVDEVVEKSKTIFPKNADGNPIFWDYQIRGFFKDSCSALNRCKGAEIAKESCSMKAYKKIIDGCIFVEPREIPIDMHGGAIGNCQRPLRAQTAQGERVALANSETVPAGSTIEFSVICLNDDHEKAVIEWFNYGKYRGMGQWRNAGMGRFLYELLDEEGNTIGGNLLTEKTA